MLFTPQSRQHYFAIASFVLWLQTNPKISTIHQPDLLLMAFIHKSYACDYVGEYAHNERLEFLWDGILWAIVNKFLYLDYANLPESQLTLYKIKLVREETLASVAMSIWMDKLILLWHGEEKQWGRAKPSILSDTLEAFLGYLYLDQPMQIVESFVRTYIYTRLDEALKSEYKSYKSLLQEYIQKEYKVLPTYNTKLLAWKNPETYVAEVFLDNQLLWKWEGKNKKIAEEQAAKQAREDIKNKITWQ